jgi:hypothetical protein
MWQTVHCALYTLHVRWCVGSLALLNVTATLPQQQQKMLGGWVAVCSYRLRLGRETAICLGGV